MSRIRVLVTDDAVVVRRLVSDVLASDPDLELAGVAANGRIALAKIPQVNPDVVILDVEMPEMDGLATLAEIRKTWPKLPVVMFSTLTERGAKATLDALALGASDYVTKPSNVGSVTVAMQRVREELIPKLKGLCGRWPGPAPALAPARAARPGAPAPRRPAGAPPRRPDVVAIGVSTGGPNALAEVLPALPADLSVPVVIVQHMPPHFTRLLAERLDKTSALSVAEASPNQVLRPGTVWLAPGDFHLTLARSDGAVLTKLGRGPQENSCRPAVDVLFRSVVEAYGPHVLGVVLTGMGYDGLRGSGRIVEAGGSVLAQDQASSVVWGMPGAVANAGLADRVLPLGAVAQEIARRVQQGRVPGLRPTAVTAGAATTVRTGGFR